MKRFKDKSNQKVLKTSKFIQESPQELEKHVDLFIENMYKKEREDTSFIPFYPLKSKQQLSR